jgi:tetratricopeptide (TPR) repeat protein
MAQAEAVTAASPGLAQAWLMLGAIQVETNQPQRAQESLRRYLELQREAGGSSRSAAQGTPTDPTGTSMQAGADPHGTGADDAGVSQAWLLMAQAAQMQGDLAAAEAYLGRIDDPRRLLEVQSRRASLLVRQGKVDEALSLIRKVPDSDDDAARSRLAAEVRVLREAQRWQQAFELLGQANTRWPDDTDLLYEQAMAAERIERLDDMERLLRRVITLQPDHGHAHNALGYSLADRNVRLDEARALIVRALELNPGDPFITDSLGWVEYRLGRLEEAERLLREAYGKRPDVEIGVHLGEVLWVAGRAEEARRVWREVRGRDPDNEVLKRTLQRLQPGL